MNDFCPTLDEMMKSNRAVGESGRVYNGLAAISTRNNLRTIRTLMEELRPARTLEIGLSFGGSALVFCAEHQRRHQPAAQHVAIDPFQTTHWDSCGLGAIERAGLSGFLDFRQRFSAIELPRMLDAGERFGLIYVDGSHLFEDVFLDAYFGSRLLEDGGIIAFDDSSDPNVRKVIYFLRSNVHMLEEIDLNYGRRNSLVYAAARHLGKVQMTAFKRIGSIDRKWDAKFEKF